MKETALYNSHVQLGAKLVPFAGYKMPVSYPEGIQSEYFTVRDKAGIFDVSHMGEFTISGSGATAFLQKMTINNVDKLQVGEAQYSAMCYPNGGIIDDLILYRKSDGYFMVVNASNIEKDFDWLSEHRTENVDLKNLSEEYSLIALQGPKSGEILSTCTDANLKMPFYSFEDAFVFGNPVMVSRTGYTGELGFEIYGESNVLIHIWDELINVGVSPAGLAARDILRMEMKYCLYGNDIDKSTNPIEAGLSWITALSNGDFIGKDALLEIKRNGTARMLISFVMEERGIPRQGYEVFVDSQKVGIVTSGTQSPKLKIGFGLAYVDRPFNKIGQNISIQIRNKFISAKIIKPPFIKGTSLHY
ncbi:MAG: glycine cleavage system aminomethyltransferase GcvT [Candidatus Marinimicrobia bacterium]|nr:glycine cleavage system aminomethyltransferase GcvT [Candidatus Neomarinimicrobiota bacterium]